MNMTVHRNPAEMEKLVGKLEQFCDELGQIAGKIASDCAEAARLNQAMPLNRMFDDIGQAAEEMQVLIPRLEALGARLHSSSAYIAQAEAQGSDNAAGTILADCTAIRDLQYQIEGIYQRLRRQVKNANAFREGNFVPEESRHEKEIDAVLDQYDALLAAIDRKLLIFSDADSDEKDELYRLQKVLVDRRGAFYRRSARYWNRQQESIDRLARLVQDSRTYIQSYTALLVQGIRAQEDWLHTAISTPVFGQEYDTMEDVRDYLIAYKRLPVNYIDKAMAAELHFKKGRVNINGVEVPVSIGSDTYDNWDDHLPSFETRYYECDIDALGTKKRGGKRIVYSEDCSMIFYTDSHYTFFDPIYWASDF